MGRLETGKTQCGDDWPGIFIRGDNALMGYVPGLKAMIDGKGSLFDKATCNQLLKLLMSANARSAEEPQRVVLASDIHTQLTDKDAEIAHLRAVMLWQLRHISGKELRSMVGDLSDTSDLDEYIAATERAILAEGAQGGGQ